MAQLLVRNVDDAVVERLKMRAAREKTSLEQTVRTILAEATRPSKAEVLARIDAIRSRMPPVDEGTTTALIRAWRDGDETDD